MLCLWSVKGGAGCSVTSAALALLIAQRQPALLVDLAGDLPAVLGVDPGDAGIADWSVAPEPPPDALARLELSIAGGLSLLPLGGPPGGGGRSAGGASSQRARLLARLLAAEHRRVVVDVGTGADAGAGTGSSAGPWRPVLEAAERSVLVVRPCYLAVSRAARQVRPDGIIVVREPGRALRSTDIEQAVGAPVLVTVPWDPAVARTVDAGLLARRLPRSLRGLAGAVDGAAPGR
jgi:MinD-like ATPase involved in chromosome partitioning or flagellar assembly